MLDIRSLTNWRPLVQRIARGMHRPSRRAATPPASPTLEEWPEDLSHADVAILRRAAAFTLTSASRQVALLEAVRYVVQRNIPGAFVECGVWRGGSAMIIAMALVEAGVLDRDLYLCDTYDGMTPPTDLDRSLDGRTAREQLAVESRDDASSVWCRVSLEEVRRNMASTGYPMERIHLVAGPVEHTIPAHAPAAVALLRLDTDWYASTRHELHHLFPRVSPNGIVILDDYGHWQGVRRAVDEYLQGCPSHYLMHRLDYTGRLLIKN
jgi:O-methyltransferase